MASDESRKAPEPSDERLMQEFAKGNEGSFITLYWRYSGSVYGYLKRKLKEETMVEEAFQEVFLRVTKARRTFDPSSKFSPWLFSIVHHCLVDAVRREGRNRQSIEAFSADRSVETPEEAINQRNLYFLLSSLSEKDRRVLTLRFVDDLPFDGVAARTGMTVANVRQIASRAIKRLRKEYS